MAWFYGKDGALLGGLVCSNRKDPATVPSSRPAGPASLGLVAVLLAFWQSCPALWSPHLPEEAWQPAARWISEDSLDGSPRSSLRSEHPVWSHNRAAGSRGGRICEDAGTLAGAGGEVPAFAERGRPAPRRQGNRLSGLLSGDVPLRPSADGGDGGVQRAAAQRQARTPDPARQHHPDPRPPPTPVQRSFTP